MRKRRLGRIRYTVPECVWVYTMNKAVKRLHAALDMHCMPHVIIKHLKYFGDVPSYEFFIDRGKNSWEDVSREIDRVWHTKLRYTNEYYIDDGELKKYTE